MAESPHCWNVSFIDDENDLFRASFMGSADEARQLSEALQKLTPAKVVDVQVSERIPLARSRSAADALQSIANAVPGDQLPKDVLDELQGFAAALGSPDGSAADREYDVSFFFWQGEKKAFLEGFWSSASIADVRRFECALSQAWQGLKDVRVSEPQKQADMQDLYGVADTISDALFCDLGIEEAVDEMRVSLPR